MSPPSPSAVPTITFRLLFVFVVLRHDRRELLHLNVTDHPTAVWTTRQIVEAFPDDTAPRYLPRDRDAVYAAVFAQRVTRMGIREVLIAPRAPWQNPFVERVIGSIRRECLDHFIIVGEAPLRRLLRAYLAYYNTVRPHQSLEQHAPRPREVQSPALGRVVAIPQSAHSITSTSAPPDHGQSHVPRALIRVTRGRGWWCCDRNYLASPEVVRGNPDRGRSRR